MRSRFRFRLRAIARAIQQVISVGLRATLSGKNYLDYEGRQITLRGTNQGNWGENYDIDAPNIKGLGAGMVRILIRWQGPYDVGTDSYSSNPANDYLDPTNYAKFKQELDWIEAQGLWMIIAVDTDYGAGNRGLGTADWNFFDTTDTAGRDLYKAQFAQVWRRIVTDAKDRQRVLAYELLPEPMPTGSNSSHGPILKQFYRDMMDVVRAIDDKTPFLIGPRASYGLNNIAEVLMTDRTDVIYTPDFLTNKVEDEAGFATDVETLAAFRDTYNVPVLVQQIGRNTSEDEGNGTTTDNLGLTALNGALSLMNAYGIPYTHWQYHQNSTVAGNYSLWYKINAGQNNSINWAPKVNEIESFRYHMQQTGQALEQAAIAAAIAANGQLFYVKDNLSNVFQTNDTSTPVTAIGQTVGRINAVVGTGNLSQATSTLRPTLVKGVNGYALQMDGVDDFLALDTTYFATTTTHMTVMASGRSAAGAANRVIFHCGTSATVVRWPFLALIGTDEYSASWRADDNVLLQANSITLGDNRAFVAGARMRGNTSGNANKFIDLQGVQEGTTNTTVVGSIASLTRSRFGATTSGTNCFGGPLNLLFICKTDVTDEQYRAIARWAAWLAGAPFRGAIPASTNVYSEDSLGGQIATPLDFSADAVHCDLMMRARNFALTSGTVPSGSVKYLEASGLLYVQSMTRTAGVTSVVLSSTPGPEAQIYTGMHVAITCPGDTSFNVERAEITVTDQTHFSYVNPGPDKTFIAANSYDVAATSINSVSIGAAGHPIEDFYSVLSTVSGTATSVPDLNGTYNGVFPGTPPASITVDGATLSNYTAGGSTFTLTISGVQSSFVAIQFNGVPTDGSFRVPRIIRTDHDQTGNTYLRPDFAQFLSRYGFMRFMDGGRTNNNAYIKSFAGRPKVASGLGMTVEQMISMCNQLNCDMWYCVPVWATDDYVEGVATLIRDNLNKNLSCYFEHSNEVWNSGAFAQWHWMLTKVRYETQALLSNIDNIDQIQSISRTGSTVTVTLKAGVAMPYTTGQSILVRLVDSGDAQAGDVDTNSAVVTVTGPSTFTYNLAGTAGAKTWFRAMIYGNTASNLFSDGITYSPFDLIHRMHAKRTYEIAQKVKGVFGVLNGRAKILLMGQMDDYDDGPYGMQRRVMLPWLTSNYGVPVKSWLWGIGGAAYSQCTGTETTVAGVKTGMNANLDAMQPSLHAGRYLATLYGLEYMLYEGGPDATLFYNTNNALVTSFFSSQEMQDVTLYNIQKVFGYGANKYCMFQTSMCHPGLDGDKTWGVARTLTDGGGQINAGTAKRLLGIDSALLAGKPAVQDPNVLPGTIYFEGGSSYKDDLGNTFPSNGMRFMYNASSVLRAGFYAPPGNVTLTVWGKMKNAADYVKIYINGIYLGNLALFRDGTGVGSGASGGSASPSTFRLPIGYSGWHVITIEPPTVINDEIGISRIVGV